MPITATMSMFTSPGQKLGWPAGAVFGQAFAWSSGGVGIAVAGAPRLLPTGITVRRLIRLEAQAAWVPGVRQGPTVEVAQLLMLVPLKVLYSTRAMFWPAPVAGPPLGDTTPGRL